MPIKWVVFDAMGVIFNEGRDLTELLIPFVLKKDQNASPEHIKDVYIEASLGIISSQEAWHRLGFSNKYPEIEKEYLDSCLTIDSEFIKIAEELKEKYSLALLSNDVKEWSTYLRKKYDINRLFKIIMISGNVGLRKPDLKIFELLLEKIQSPPENCVFVDDNLNNINAASQLGIKTIRFIRKNVKTPFCSEFEISSFPELLFVLKNYY